MLGPDSGIIQKVQDLSNNLLTSNNDASLNNVDICGNLNIKSSLAIDNSFGVSGEVLTSQGSMAQPIWDSPESALAIYGFLATPLNNKSIPNSNTIVMDDINTSGIWSGPTRYSLPVANYNTANSTYTIPKTGYYLVGWNLFVTAPLNNTWEQNIWIQLMSMRDGNDEPILTGGLNGSENETRHAVLYLEKDDIIRLRFQASVNAQLQYNGGHYSCWYAFKVN